MALLDPQLEEVIDLSIVKQPIFWEQDDRVPEMLFFWHYRGSLTRTKVQFWKGIARRVPFAPLRGHWLPRGMDPNIARVLELRTYELISEQRLEELSNPYSIIKEPEPMPFDWRLMDQLKECTPQFFLRNIGRVEKSIDLEDPMDFREEPVPKWEAIEAWEEGKKAKIPKAEFSDLWTVALMKDFSIFMDEMMHLCPWEEIPDVKHRGAKFEGTLWDPAYSRAQMTVQLIERGRRGTIMALGKDGKFKEIAFGPRKAKRFAKVISSTPDQKS